MKLKSEEYFIRRAIKNEDHKAILKVAKTSKYTKDFGSIMFSPDAAYEKGWIKVADMQGEIIAFTCVRHKVRELVTMLYFICVHPDHRDGFIGERMLESVMRESPHEVMALNVMKENRAVNFYDRMGFKIVGEAIKGQAHRMEKKFIRSS